MQVHTERGLINVEAEYQSEEKAKIDGYSYAFYSKELEKKVYSKCLDDRGLYHTFALIVGCNQNNYSIPESEVQQMKKYWYLKIKLKDKYDGRKIWYMNYGYICDCVNLPFQYKEECNASIPMIERKFGDRSESITLHGTR